MKTIRSFIVVGILLGGMASPEFAFAYIGPGAGFAFLSSFLFIFGAGAIALLLILTLPIRLLFKSFHLKKRHGPTAVDRLIILGLDGLDPELAEEFMAKGELPEFSELKKQGRFSPLRITNPPISPVSWSSFQTGVNPGKHNIFDFLSRDPQTYLPALSSAEISSYQSGFRLGFFQRFRKKARVKMLRKSVPFWKILGDHGVFSIVLKVPITYPPEKFKGLLLSGLCAPDLKGTQGTFTYYTTRPSSGETLTSGYYLQLSGEGPDFTTFISGPARPDGQGDSKIPLRISVDREKEAAVLSIQGKHYHLSREIISPWITMSFSLGKRKKVQGIAQFFLKNVSPHLELYLSPVQIDPSSPALPISHPLIYSVYLSKLFDSFATMGLPQDTWALNEEVLNDLGFLQQTWGIHEKLEQIFFHSLDQVKKGLVCCVFDTTDVIQHEFWRYRVEDHPALRGKNIESKPPVIEELYQKMDNLVGRVRKKLRPRDLLLIVSDHGFKLFRRGVNINTWLFQNGYLSLKGEKTTNGEWLKDVDWSRTRAYALGLNGIYLNRKGREREGIVVKSEAEELKKELIAKLTDLPDEEEGGKKAVTTLYDADKIYTGPYKNNAPDLIAGFYPGWRHSWESVMGQVTEKIFIDNEKAWSADHCIDPRFVPGVFFSSRKVEGEEFSITDLAPTALSLFGIKPPEYMDGKTIKFK